MVLLFLLSLSFKYLSDHGSPLYYFLSSSSFPCSEISASLWLLALSYKQLLDDSDSPPPPPVLSNYQSITNASKFGKVNICPSANFLFSQDAGGQQIGFLLGSCGIALALTTEVCLKGLPKTQNGEIVQFKGSLSLFHTAS